MVESPHLNILLAENDSDDRMLITEAVESSGASCTIQWVENGERALEYLRREGRYSKRKNTCPPDLIMLDLNMPVMDGWETLEELKKDPALAPIPVIFLTTSEVEDDVRRAYSMGASSYITKPASFEGLVDIFRKISVYWTTTSQHPEPASEYDRIRSTLIDKK